MNIILTATINCRNCLSTIEKNAIKREAWYLNSVEKYLKNTNFDLIFVENSNYSLNKIKSLVNGSKRVEILSYSGNKDVDIYGKGHGEKEILHYALENSEKLKNQDYFYKVSGRYVLFDLEKQITDMEKENLLSVNFPMSKFSSVVFGCNKELFKKFFPKNSIIDDRVKIFEFIYIDLIKSIDSKSIKILQPFECEEILTNNNNQAIKKIG